MGAVAIFAAACSSEGGGENGGEGESESEGEGEAEAESESESESEPESESFEPVDKGRFATLVYPIMLDTCAGSSCHAPANDFPLTVFSDDVSATYDRAIQFVNVDDPPASQLLTVPVGNGFIEGPGDSRYDTILAWIAGTSAPGE